MKQFSFTFATFASRKYEMKLTSHVLMDVAEVKYVILVVSVLIELEKYTEFSVANPVRLATTKR